MPIDRNTAEADTAAALAILFGNFRAKINGGTPNFYRFGADVSDVLWARLSAVYREAANEFSAKHSGGELIGIDDRADRYGSLIGSKIAVSLVDGLRTDLNYVAQQNMSLDSVLSDGRAMGIAVTEITRAISQAQLYAAGVVAVVLASRVSNRWRTESDDRVCPICGPLDGQDERQYSGSFPGGPPAHPNCRCSLEFSFSPIVAGV